MKNRRRLGQIKIKIFSYIVLKKKKMLIYLPKEMTSFLSKVRRLQNISRVRLVIQTKTNLKDQKTFPLTKKKIQNNNESKSTKRKLRQTNHPKRKLKNKKSKANHVRPSKSLTIHKSMKKKILNNTVNSLKEVSQTLKKTKIQNLQKRIKSKVKFLRVHRAIKMLKQHLLLKFTSKARHIQRINTWAN